MLCYRHVRGDGEVFGGAIRYISKGLAEKKMLKVEKTLAVIFALMCIGGSFSGGNMFQANQAFTSLKATAPTIMQYNLDG